MKKTLLKLAFLMFVLTAVFIACQKDFEAIFDNGSMTVEDAILWYKAHLPDKMVLKSGSSEKLLKVVMPDWKSAFKSGNSKVEVVEANLLSQGGYGFATQETHDEWTRTGDTRYLTSMPRLVILKYRSTGETVSFLMTMIADKTYLKRNKFKLWQNSYLKKDKDFSGLVLYHSLEGKFVNGWRFANGSVTHTITNLNMESGSEMRLKSGHYSCTTQDIFEWYQECTDYYNVGECGDYYSEPTYSHTTCSNPYLVYEGSYQECAWVIDSSGDTSGGYLPPGSILNDTLKKLFYKGTVNLDPVGIDYLNMAFDKIEKDCMFNLITNYLQDKALILGSILINTNQIQPAKYNGIGDLTFAGNWAISSPNLAHEWFHIGQKKIFNTNLSDGYAEFENWLFADIRETVRVNCNFDSSNHQYACYKPGFEVYKVEYQNWLKGMTNNGATVPTSMNTVGFYKFGPIFAKEVRTEYSFLNFSNNNSYLPRTMIYLFENCK